MKILGNGIDIIEIPRIRAAIERHGERFFRKVYTAAEVAYCESKKDKWASYAARWAAKEAVFKAYGKGWEGVWWLNQIEVTKHASGKPGIRLLPQAAAAQAHLAGAHVELSLTHGREIAFAQALLVSD